MKHLPVRTRLLAVLALVAVIAGGLYYFKLRKSDSSTAAPSTTAVATTAPIAFVSRANAVCEQERQGGAGGPATIPRTERTAARVVFASADATVRNSVQALPQLLHLIPPPTEAALWGRYLQSNAEILDAQVRLRALARHHARRPQLAAAATPLTRDYALQRALAARLGLMACATAGSSTAAAPATSSAAPSAGAGSAPAATGPQ